MSKNIEDRFSRTGFFFKSLNVTSRATFTLNFAWSWRTTVLIYHGLTIRYTDRCSRLLLSINIRIILRWRYEITRKKYLKNVSYKCTKKKKNKTRTNRVLRTRHKLLKTKLCRCSRSRLLLVIVLTCRYEVKLAIRWKIPSKDLRGQPWVILPFIFAFVTMPMNRLCLSRRPKSFIFVIAIIFVFLSLTLFSSILFFLCLSICLVFIILLCSYISIASRLSRSYFLIVFVS